ncbi:ABC transporter permease [Paenibacillus sp. PR3]|uniref:ABC transporter permease n=2 Tax=Paenibacillus terricola TaxID=2763503 RepID=A0ABR8MVQ7_9BACL|nr:ABC transporter permease [Paenibacillus terricola]
MLLLHKGLLFICLYFFLSIGTMVILDEPANPEVEMNRMQYRFYLNQVQGPYTEETEHFFTSEANKISDAKVALQRVTDNFYDGYIGEQEFLTSSDSLAIILKNEVGFQLVYNQYVYVRENPDNRKFLNTNGWDGLLSNDSLDFLFILLVLLLVTPIFCYEFESKMDALLLTVKKGAKTHTLCKIGLVFVIVSLLCLVTAGLRYGFYSFKYGLENGDYPLQSLSYFGTSIKDVTLLQSFLWITIGKLLGNLCFATLILFASVCFKKYAITLFSCTTVVLLPYYGLKLESSKFLWPGPLGFMVSTGFFRGNEFKRNLVKDQMELIFREVSFTSWIIVFTITFSLCVVMLIVILHKRTNVWIVQHRKRRRRLPLLILVLGIAVSMLVGCNSFNGVMIEGTYNYSSKGSFENDKYRFYMEQTEFGNNQIVFEDKTSGEKHNLVRNPMTSLTQIGAPIYGDGTYIYYMKIDFEKIGFQESATRFSVIGVDITRFNEKIIFEKKLSTDKGTVLGLVKGNTYVASFYLTVSAFFLDESSLYLIGQSNGQTEIRKINRTTGAMSVLFRIPVLRSFAFDGRTIYFVDEKSQIVKYDTKTDIMTSIIDLVTRDFILTDTELLFLNRKDQQKIYAMNLHDSTIRKLTEVPVLSFRYNNPYITYIGKIDMKEYQLFIDSSSN